MPAASHRYPGSTYGKFLFCVVGIINFIFKILPLNFSLHMHF